MEKRDRHDWITLAATIVMTIATIAMCNLGRQQTRLAEAAERRNAYQEEERLFAAKKELSLTVTEVIDILEEGRSLTNLTSWTVCEINAGEVFNRMDRAMNNNYLFNNRSEARVWETIRNDFGVLKMRANKPGSRGNNFEKDIVDDYAKVSGQALSNLFQIHKSLVLSPLVPVESK